MQILVLGLPTPAVVGHGCNITTSTVYLEGIVTLSQSGDSDANSLAICMQINLMPSTWQGHSGYPSKYRVHVKGWIAPNIAIYRRCILLFIDTYQKREEIRNVWGNIVKIQPDLMML